MGTDSIDPLELEDILLPPIPGPLPTTFFTDIPSNASAVFSTFLGTRPLRSLPHPIPLHLAHTGNHDDIRMKAWSLIHNYPSIAEPITTPPDNWQDLYAYFDAVDLWMEGAGFLFHVLGFIVKVNITRFNCIQRYAGEWVFGNEERLANIPLSQDILSSLSTVSDHAWFDFGNLTLHQKLTLTSVLNWHRDLLRTKQDSSRVVQPQQSEAFSLGTRTNPHVISPGSYQYYGVPAVYSPTQNRYHQDAKSQARFCDVRGPYYPNSQSRNKNNAIAVGITEGHHDDRPVLDTGCTITNVIGNRKNYAECSLELLNNQQRGENISYPMQNYKMQVNMSSEPVYVLDSQKRSTSLQNEGKATQNTRYHDSFPLRSDQRALNGSHQVVTAQDGQQALQYLTATRVVSNDARVHYDATFTQSLEQHSKSAEPWAFRNAMNKPPWSRMSFERDCTVYVGGLEDDCTLTNPVVRLLSQCGQIINLRPLQGSRCAFVVFDNPESAVYAINRFNGYEMDNNRILTVSRPRKKETSGSYISHTAYHDSSRRLSQTRNNDNFTTHRRQSVGSRYGELRPSPGLRTTSNGSWYRSRDSSLQSPPPNSQGSVGVINEGREMGQARETEPIQQTATFVAKKEKFSADCFQPQIHSIGGVMRTPEHTRQNSGLEETTPKVSEQREGYSTRYANKRGSRTGKRGKWKMRGSLNSTPTHTPMKKSSNIPLGGSVETDGFGKISSVGDIDVTPTKCNLGVGESPCNTLGTSTIDEIQHVAENSVLSTKAEEVDKKSDETTSQINLASQHSAEELKTELQPQIGVPGISTKVSEDDSSNDGHFETASSAKIMKPKREASDNKSTNSPASNEAHQRKNNVQPKQKKKKSWKSSKGSRDEIGEGFPPPSTLDTSQKNNEHGIPGADSCSPPNADGIITLVSTSSIQGLSGHFSVASNASISPRGPVSESMNPEEKPSQNNNELEDEPVHDSRAAASAKHSKNSKSQSTVASSDFNGSSTRNYDSEMKNNENRRPDGSPTPTGKTQFKNHKNCYEKKDAELNRKENEQPLPSPEQILADPTHWPALGSTKPQSEPKSSNLQKKSSIVKPLGERMPPPSLVRRDSLASVVSQSPQVGRRLTIDLPGSPISGGSPLWPVVKRWDGRPPAGSSKSATSAAGTE